MNAHAHLTRLQARFAGAARARAQGSSNAREAVSPSRSSILSYDETRSLASVARDGEAAFIEEEVDDVEELPTRAKGWRGLNTPMPLPSLVSARRAPTKVFDDDFIPDENDPYSLRHSEYGHDTNPAHRVVSQYGRREQVKAEKHVEDEPPMAIYLMTYLSYALLICIGHVRDFFGKWMFPAEHAHLRPHQGYAPLFSDFDSFYTRRLKLRIDDCFARPITAVAGRTATLLDRTSSNHNASFTFTGETTQALNISSYNYLGFAQSRGPCAVAAEDVVKAFGVSNAGERAMGGTNAMHLQLERLMSAFLGTEDCLVVANGFGTNSTTLPALMSKGCLIISDELNHSSIRFGARLSGAMVRQFRHNDMDDLEKLLRECISQGQPRTHRPWKKILVVVEGLYSMEGTTCHLRDLMRLKEVYKFYLYIDEAHSIGALGPNGGGVCDYYGVNPRKVDILMGTFTKSFGAAGGYIAGSHTLISALRLASHAENYAEAMAPPVISQIITSTASLMGTRAHQYIPALKSLSPALAAKMDGREGKDRLQRLAFNSRYFHHGLKALGFIVYGSQDSPIVPLMVYQPGKLPSFSRLMLERWGIIVVLAAYPATDLVSSRIRFCLSSAHTKADLDRVLMACDDVGTLLGLKSGTPKGGRKSIEEVLKGGVERVRETERVIEI